MPQQVRTRNQQTLSYNANNTVTERLGRGMIYRELMLNLRGAISVGSDFQTSVNGNVLPGLVWAVVKEIRIVANGNDVIRKITGEELAVLNQHLYGTIPYIGQDIVATANSGTFTFESALIVPFWMPNSFRPFDTALNSKLLSDLRIEIDWGDVNSVIDSSVTGEAWATEPSLDVFSLESFGVDGQFAQWRTVRRIEQSVSIGDDFRIELPVGTMYRHFLIHAEDSNGDDLAGAIDDIRVKSGTTIFMDLNGELGNRWNRLRQGVQAPLYTATGVEQGLANVSDGYDAGAWYWLDLVTDGRNNEAIDTLGLSEFFLEMDISAAIDKLTVIASQVIPVRQPANGGRSLRAAS